MKFLLRRIGQNLAEGVQFSLGCPLTILVLCAAVFLAVFLPLGLSLTYVLNLMSELHDRSSLFQEIVYGLKNAGKVFLHFLAIYVCYWMGRFTVEQRPFRSLWDRLFVAAKEAWPVLGAAVLIGWVGQPDTHQIGWWLQIALVVLPSTAYGAIDGFKKDQQSVVADTETTA